MAFLPQRFSKAPVSRKESFLTQREIIWVFFLREKDYIIRYTAFDDIYKGYYFSLLVFSLFFPLSH